MKGRRRLPVSIGLVVLLSVTCCMGALVCGCENGEKVDIKKPTGKPVEEIPDDRKMTYDDVLYGEYVTDLALSPDGRTVAWIKEFGEPGMEARAGNLFLTDLETGATEQLTSFDKAQMGGVVWSPDGKAIGFRTDAPQPGAEGGGTIQVWLARPLEGEPQAVTSMEDGVEGFDWIDPNTIVFTAEVPKDGSGDGYPGDDTVHVTDYARVPVRLFELDIAGGEPRQLTDNEDRIIQINVSPDGKHVFYQRTKSKMEDVVQSYSGEIPFSNYLLNLETGEEKPVFEKIVRNGGTAWARDSGTLYAVDMKVSDESLYVYNARVRTLDVESGAEELIDIDWGRGLELMLPFGLPNDPVQPLDDGFLAFMANGCNPRVARFTRSDGGWEKQWMEGEHQGNIFVMNVSDDGKTICYDHSNASKPPQLYAATVRGDMIEGPRQITQLNPDFDDRSFTRCETVQWEGALGDPVEGLLFYPSGYEPGNEYPLVLVIHGGPFECDKDRWQTYQWIDPYHLLAQKGAFVLAPNYHGSTGYGEDSIDFSGTILDGRFYDTVTKDIENGIEWLVDLGLVDEDRMGTLGWSGGSMISNALIARDQRFKAASCGAGGAEWVSLWGQSLFGDILVPDLMGADPIEDPGIYKDRSHAPFYDASRVETPVIMFQPAADVNVSPCMSWITYRGVQKHGDAPVELYVFPGEGHVLQRLPHQKRKLEEEQDWLNEYLFEK